MKTHHLFPAFVIGSLIGAAVVFVLNLEEKRTHEIPNADALYTTVCLGGIEYWVKKNDQTFTVTAPKYNYVRRTPERCSLN